MAKKILCTVMLLLALVCLLASCGEECNHNYIESVEIEPTCTTFGSKKFTCSVCGDSYSQYGTILELGHEYVESVHKEPTCGFDGKGDKKFTCNRCGDYYIAYAAIPALECEWRDATCDTPKECILCGRTEGYSLDHIYSETDGICTLCGHGVKFILPSTPVTIYYNAGWDKACKIESIKIERIQEYSYLTPQYKLTFIVQSTYHEKGNNYSDTASFGWKLYDEDGFVVISGTGYTDGNIKVGEKSKTTETFRVGTDETVQDGKTFRLELLNIS